MCLVSSVTYAADIDFIVNMRNSTANMVIVNYTEVKPKQSIDKLIVKRLVANGAAARVGSSIEVYSGDVILGCVLVRCM